MKRNVFRRVLFLSQPWVVPFAAILLALFPLSAPRAGAQLSAPVALEAATPEASMPDRLVIVYRSQTVPATLAQHLQQSGARMVGGASRWGVAVVQGDSVTDPQLKRLQQLLAADPAVAYVAHDRVVSASRLQAVRRVQQATSEATKSPATPDWYYTSTPQGWAVKQVGGYGAGTPGAPANGPWNVSMGQGVRIAVLDSGVSSTHPDTAPNLVFATSLVDQTALPSPCDDGSAEDQDGHGTWVASLAAGALGKGTGMVVGVAPKASLLNIKVLERVPAAGSGTTASLCEQGTAGGLMSWILAGIAEASSQHADIINISAGGLLDSYSGEDEGLIVAFNRAVANATQAGALVVAAVGNAGESLDNSRYVEMPAQAQDALAVVASTNAACAQNLSAGAGCVAGPVQVAYYSNYGSTLQAVAAPGGSYPEDASGAGLSGFVRGACSTGLPNTQDGLPNGNGSSFGCFSFGHTPYVEAIGTSAAAPLVAGVAALLKGANPAMLPSQLATAIRSTATPLAQSVPVAVNQVNAGLAMEAVVP